MSNIFINNEYVPKSNICINNEYVHPARAPPTRRGVRRRVHPADMSPYRRRKRKDGGESWPWRLELRQNRLPPC